MDYILRDGYHAGVPNSRFDLERILQLVGFGERGLVWDERARTAIESYFIARYHLYLQLYYHKTVRAAEVMLRLILKRARHLAEEGVELEVHPTLIKLVSARTCGASVAVSDHDLWHAFRVWQDHPDQVLSDLCRRLCKRQLFKSAELNQGTGRIIEICDRAKELVEDVGLESDYYVVLDEHSDKPYKIVDVTAGDDPDVSVRLRDSAGVEYSLEVRSGLIRHLQDEAYNKVRICFPAEIGADLLTFIREG